MDCETNIFMRIPWDVKEKITSYLNVIDIYYLTLIDKNFEDALKSKKMRKVNFSFDLRLDYKTASNVLKIIGPDNITEINLNGVYWLNVSELRRLLMRLRNLKTGFLFGTKLKVDHSMLTNFKEKTIFYMCPPSADLRSYESTSCRLDFSYIQKQDDTSLQEYILFLFSNQALIVLSKKYVNDHRLLIYDSDWLNNVSLSPDDSMVKYCNSINMKDGGNWRVEMDLNVNDATHFEKLCKENTNVKEMIIKSGRSLGQMSKLNLKQLGSLKYLQKLRIEVDSSANFLDTIFSECKQLKFLRILSYVPQFRVTHLKNAQSLEDLSLELNGSLDLESLLIELGDNERLRLRRIYLNFHHFNSLSKEVLTSFLKANPQLIVFVVITQMTDTLMKKLTKSVQPYCQSPQKVYFFKKVTQKHRIISDLYNMHYDLLDARIVI